MDLLFVFETYSILKDICLKNISFVCQENVFSHSDMISTYTLLGKSSRLGNESRVGLP